MKAQIVTDDSGDVLTPPHDCDLADDGQTENDE
jgi:hypothetical protein